MSVSLRSAWSTKCVVRATQRNLVLKKQKKSKQTKNIIPEGGADEEQQVQRLGPQPAEEREPCDRRSWLGIPVAVVMPCPKATRGGKGLVHLTTLKSDSIAEKSPKQSRWREVTHWLIQF